jgi:hypothetical protein
MVNAPGIRPRDSTPTTPLPPWIAIVVLQKIKENDKKIKKIKNFEISICYVFKIYQPISKETREDCKLRRRREDFMSPHRASKKRRMHVATPSL